MISYTKVLFVTIACYFISSGFIEGAIKPGMPESARHIFDLKQDGRGRYEIAATLRAGRPLDEAVREIAEDIRRALRDDDLPADERFSLYETLLSFTGADGRMWIGDDGQISVLLEGLHEPHRGIVVAILSGLPHAKEAHRQRVSRSVEALMLNTNDALLLRVAIEALGRLRIVSDEGMAFLERVSFDSATRRRLLEKAHIREWMGRDIAPEELQVAAMFARLMSGGLDEDLNRYGRLDETGLLAAGKALRIALIETDLQYNGIERSRIRAISMIRDIYIDPQRLNTVDDHSGMMYLFTLILDDPESSDQVRRAAARAMRDIAIATNDDFIIKNVMLTLDEAGIRPETLQDDR